MKRLNQATVIFYLLTLYAAYTAAKSHKDIHHLLTSDEREQIFGHPFVENVPEYDICHPVQVDTSGNFLSHDLMNGNSRRKRDTSGSLKEPVFFKLSAFGDEFHLNVSLNDELFSSNFEIEIRGNGTREFHYDIEHCHYIGELLPAKGNKVAVSNCDGLKGLIRTPQAVLMVNPLPDRLGLGKNKSRAHVIHRRSATPLGTLEEAMDLDKRSDSWCGVEADPSSWQTLEEEDEHMNFPRSTKNKPSTIESMIVIEKVMTKAYGVDQIKKYVPTIVNMAHGLLDDASIGADIKYIIHKLLILEEDMPGLVISNHAASTLSNFCKWTTGQNIADDNNPAHFDHAALISKYNFCRNKRQAKAKAEGCGDILGLADLQGMCKQDTSCTLNKDTGLGTAFTLAHETAHNLGAEHDAEGNKCKNGVNIMATRAAGKVTAFDWSPCSRKYVTSFLQTVQAQCLRDKAENKVKIPKGLPGKLYDGNDQCVRMFGAGSRVCTFSNEKMCVNLYCELPDGSGYCNSNDEPAADGTKCGPKKWCRRGLCVAVGTKGYEDVDGQWGAWSGWEPCYPSCGGGVSKRVRECDNPAPKRAGKLCEGKGTEYKYCKQQKCPPRFEKPRMTQCKSKRNVEFARGQTYKWIFDPYYAGKDTKTCVLSCATAGGDVSNFGNLKDGTSCSKGVCINDGKCEAVGCDGSIGSRAKVDRCGVCNGDGSTCGGGGGEGGGKTPAPKPKPKPTRPSEPPTEKPSSGGKLRKFTYSQVPGYDYYQDIATLPVGARKIRIEEVTPSENSLMLDTPDGYNLLDYDTYYADYGPAKFQGAGTTFLLKKKNNKEVITAEGPLTEKLKLVYEAVIEGVKYTVKYQYVAPGAQSDWGLESDLPEIFGELSELNKQLDDAENEGEELEEELNSFTWMKSAAEECSVSCGGGTDTTTYVCVRVDDESPVGDQFCKEERPEDEIKDCNTQRCPARWMIGFWTECSKSCNDGSHGMRTREVFCVEDSQGIELELKENECKKPKPITQEVCGQQACPAEWDTVQVGPCSTSCGPGVQPLTVKCIKTNTSGESEPTDEKDCTDIKPPTHVTCNVENPCEA